MKNLLKILTISLLLFSCGFTPILKNLDNSKIFVKKLNVNGDNSNNLVFLLKNYLSIEEKPDLDGVTVTLNITETTESVEKDSAGITIKEKMNISVVMFIDNEKNILINKETFDENKEIIVTSNPEVDIQNKDSERKNILRNLSRSMKFKLFIMSKNYK